MLLVIRILGGVREGYATEDAEDKTANDQLKSAQVSLNCYWDDDLDQEVFHCRWFHAASLHTVI